MTENPASVGSSVWAGGHIRLFDTCRAMIAEKGFGALTLRSVALTSGWTMGALAYRIGTKEQLLAAFLDHERAGDQARDKAWLDRLAGVTEFDGPLLSAIVQAVIDDAAENARNSVIVWHEALAEAATGVVPSAQVAAWIGDRHAHWQALLAGRHPRAAMLGRLVADYIIAERIYTAVLFADPEYRLILAACTARLTGTRDGARWADWEIFLPRVPLGGAGVADTAPQGRQARRVAEAAGRIILERGPTALTHRAVATVLGQSSSAVSHHFSALGDLMSAGFDSLYRNVQSALRRVDSNSGPIGNHSPAIPAAISFVRAMHIIALVAARDASFVPLMREERASRGRMIEDWYGHRLLNGYESDRLLLQVISLIAGARTLQSALHCEMLPGGNVETLREIFMVMG